MGFCRNCFFTAPQAGESIIRPELSRAHEDEEDRDLDFEKSYQLQPHAVYLANSGALKVGVTRAEQKLNRWTDQGASQAVVLALTENRYQAGQIEVALKEQMGDKTPWQRMLKNEIPTLDLLAERQKAAALLPAELRRFVVESEQVYHINYPVEKYPSKVKTLKLDRDASVEAVLQGIKGQYLILEGGTVFNVRGSSGYRVKIAFA